jgi:hypothetical protein
MKIRMIVLLILISYPLALSARKGWMTDYIWH